MFLKSLTWNLDNYGAMQFLAIDKPGKTADPLILTKAAQQLVERADFGAVTYVRAGVMLMDLVPAGANIPLDGLAYEHERRDIAGLLASVQEKCGAGSVGLGLAGFSMPAE